MSSTEILFKPLKIGSITVHNRIFISALTRDRAIGTVPTDVVREYYRQRAAGGAGLIVSEGILITRQGYVRRFRPLLRIESRWCWVYQHGMAERTRNLESRTGGGLEEDHGHGSCCRIPYLCSGGLESCL